jgi:tetratricopeptide (TPR) repeat protein
VSTHLSRKELKQDNVALKVEETTHFLVTHRALVTKVGGVVLAVLVIGFGTWFFISSRRDAREQALANALTIQNAPVGAAAQTTGQSFATEAAKSDAVRKAFNNIISQDSGSDEAYAAEYYLAGIDLTAGKTDDALKKYDHVATGSNPDYASMAKLSKAQILFSLNRAPEAKTVLKDLIAHPTAMVSKDQASLVLARGIAATQPEEARKLLTPIAAEQSDVAQAASAALGELPAK